MHETILEMKQRLGRPLVMGHRGASGHAPENTMASFKLAAEMGVDAIELDCHLSQDGHLIVMHDETVDRTTNGHGPIGEMTLAELQALDAGSWFDPRFAGERVPTLDEVLSWAKGKMPVVIEVKPSLHAAKVVEAVIALVERHQMAEEVAVISFDHFVPLGVKHHRPHWITGVLYVGRLVDPTGMAGAAQANGLLPNFAFVTPDLMTAAHRERLWVGCWCPNSEPELTYALSTGVDMIGTNYPDRLFQLIKGRS